MLRISMAHLRVVTLIGVHLMLLTHSGPYIRLAVVIDLQSDNVVYVPVDTHPDLPSLLVKKDIAGLKRIYPQAKKFFLLVDNITIALN